MTSNIAGIERQLCQMLDRTYQTVPDELQYIKNKTRAWIY